ncbi:hypothetical protein HF689_17535 [Bacillus safensis]|nr:hypothetical protein [Bacillus safensis]
MYDLRKIQRALIHNRYARRIYFLCRVCIEEWHNSRKRTSLASCKVRRWMEEDFRC